MALTRNVSSDILSILDDPNPGLLNAQDISCANFYSISTQRGLSGVELGSFLIKRVVSELHEEFPNIKKFCTLSPIPGFRQWLLNKLGEPNEDWIAQDIMDKSTVRKVMDIAQVNDYKSALQV